MNTDNFITVRTYHDNVLGEIILSALNNAGIKTFRFDETHSMIATENSFEINRRARMIRDWYDKKIHERISQLGFFDWEWVEESGKCFHQDHFYKIEDIKFFDEEQVLNYIFE